MSAKVIVAPGDMVIDAAPALARPANRSSAPPEISAVPAELSSENAMRLPALPMISALPAVLASEKATSPLVEMNPSPALARPAKRRLELALPVIAPEFNELLSVKVTAPLFEMKLVVPPLALRKTRPNCPRC